MANLEKDPRAALDAIRSEVFTSQIRNRSSASAAKAAAALATLNAINRLDALQPKVGIWRAREEGFRPAVDLPQDQRQTLYRIATDLTLSRDDKLDQMAEAGLFDTALAAGLSGIGGFANRGGLLGPADRPGGGSNRASTKNPADLPGTESKPAGAANVDPVSARPPNVISGRYKPGVVSGNGKKVEGTWLSGAPEAPVPKQVADLLRGREFSTFNGLRRAFWKAVTRVPELASEFTPDNLAMMRAGNAPRAPTSLWARRSEVFHLHHVDRITDEGPVYDLDNIWVVTPARHAELHPNDSP
jgi:hypothetical protein